MAQFRVLLNVFKFSFFWGGAGVYFCVAGVCYDLDRTNGMNIETNNFSKV